MKPQVKGLTRQRNNILQKVVDLTCSEFAIEHEDIFKRSRAVAYSTPRTVAVSILRDVFKFPHQILADYFGYRNHSSVTRADLDRFVKNDPYIADSVTYILKEVKSLILNPKS